MKIRLQFSQHSLIIPRHITITNRGLAGILTASTIFTCLIIFPIKSHAAGSCTSCTYTINGNNNSNYTVRFGETMCINPGGNFTGTVTIKLGGKVCNSGTFSPSSFSFGYFATFENNSVATIPGNFSNIGTVNNYGNLTFSGNMTSWGTLNNTGSMSVNGDIENVSTWSSSFNNSGVVSSTGNFVNGSDLVNNGLIEVGGYFENSNSSYTTFTNNDSLSVGQYFNNEDEFTNYGGISVSGNFVNSGHAGASVANYGNMTVDGDLTSHNLIQNSGWFTINGSMTLSDSISSTQFINDSILVVNKDLMSSGDLTNNSYIQINGTYTNESNGVLNIGSESLMDVDSFYNNSNVVNSSTPYGQIVVFSYMDNAGDISDFVDICKSGGGSTFDSNTGTVSSNVTFCTNNSPLPVELLTFTAKKSEGVVLLEWSTASEMNNRMFEVQRRMENGTFEVIAEVAGAGNTKTVQQYKYIDASAIKNKTIYYRLRQVDFDGEHAFSGIAIVQDIDKATMTADVNIYPNPLYCQESLWVHLNEGWTEANYQVQNMSGNITVEGKITSGGRIMTSNLNPGIYLVKVYNEENARTTKVIVR